MSGKKSHFSVGECGELIFTEGAVQRIDRRKNGENGIVKNGYFVPFFSYFSPFFVLFPLAASRHNPPQPTSCVLCLPFPHFAPFPPIPLISTFFQSPKSWFGELVSSVAVSADACDEYKCRFGSEYVVGLNTQGSQASSQSPFQVPVCPTRPEVK